jgi:hypothetical protein
MSVNSEAKTSLNVDEPKSLKHYAIMCASKNNLIDKFVDKHIEYEDIKNDCLKEVKKYNIEKENEKRLEIRTMLSEIHRLKILTHCAFDDDYANDEDNEKIINLRNNIYDYYFLYEYTANFLSDLTDSEFDHYYNPVYKLKEKFENLVVEYNKKNIEDVSFDKLIKNFRVYYAECDCDCDDCDSSESPETIEFEDDDYKQSIDSLTQWVFEKEDKLLNYFKIALKNNYSKVLVRLSKFQYHLLNICENRKDNETLLHIINLYGVDYKYGDEGKDEYYIPYEYKKKIKTFDHKEISYYIKDIKGKNIIKDNINKELLEKIPKII